MSTDATTDAAVVPPERALIRAAAGGTVRSADGLFELRVYPGAIAQDTELSVRRVDPAAVPGAIAAENPVSGVYAVEPDGLQFGGDGAYAIYRFPTTPEGLVTGTGAAQTYEPLVAVAQPAAGGAIVPQPESTTLYDAPTGRVQFVARLAHLSTQFVARVIRRAVLRVGVDFGARDRRLGDPFETPLQITAAFPPNFAFDQDPVRVFAFVPPSLLILNRNTGDVGPVFPDGLEGQLAPRELVVTSWRVPVGTSPFAADPPPDFVCRAEGNGISILVGTRLHLLENAGTRDESRMRLQVMISRPYDCVDRPPPPRDAAVDVPRDVALDAPLDAGSDVGFDAPGDRGAPTLDLPPEASHLDLPTTDVASDRGPPEEAAPCPTAFTRCGGDCADLSSDFDHCGRCGNLCPTRPYAVPECRDYACRNRCITHYADCDGNAENGCETDLRRVANCGGCGLRPVELCDGVDNDCDGLIDDGCPTQIEWPVGNARSGPWFGMPLPGEAAGTIGGNRYNPIIGLCGSLNTDGSIRQLRGVVGVMRFDTDRTVMPFRYALRSEEVLPGGSRCEDQNGGGIAGGMPWAIRCPAGTVADGILGQASARLGQIQLRCAQWLVAGGGSDGPFRITRGPTVMSPQVGTAPGMPFVWLVPDHPSSGFPGALRLVFTRYPTTTNSAISGLQPHGDSAYFP